MTEILLATQPFSSTQLKAQCGLNPSQLAGIESCGPVKPNRPYAIGSPSPDDGIMNAFRCSSTQRLRHLAEIGTSLGAENLKAVADLHGQLHQHFTPGIGSGGELYGRRAGQFLNAAKKYESALMKHRAAMVGDATASARLATKNAVLAASREMNINFQHELKFATDHMSSKARHRSALTNPTRALNIARSSRRTTRLHVASQIEATNLVRFSRYGRYLGHGIVVIDFGARLGNVKTAYQSGGNWERELFIESSSFVASTIAAGKTLSVGGTALGFVIVATPIGFVGIIIGGLAVVGMAAGVGIGTNNFMKKTAGPVYDKIMAVIDGLWN